MEKKKTDFKKPTEIKNGNRKYKYIIYEGRTESHEQQFFVK